jgi:hypothetical protein
MPSLRFRLVIRESIDQTYPDSYCPRFIVSKERYLAINPNYTHRAKSFCSLRNVVILW